MPDGMIFVAFAASLILPTLVALLARAERASILLYVYLGILMTLGALLGQVLVLEFTVPVLGAIVVSAGGIALAAFVLVVTLDGLLFFLLGLPFAPDLIELITGGVVNKLVIGLIYAVLLSLYLLVSRRSVDAFRETPSTSSTSSWLPATDSSSASTKPPRTAPSCRPRLPGSRRGCPRAC